jgi:hypothetical protein
LPIIIRGEIEGWRVSLSPSLPDIMAKGLHIACGNLWIFTEIKKRVKKRIGIAPLIPAFPQIMHHRKECPSGQIRITCKIILLIKKPRPANNPVSGIGQEKPDCNQFLLK